MAAVKENTKVNTDPVETDETTDKKPRLSRVERLAQELENARVKEQARAEKKVVAIQEKLDRVAEKLLAIHAERDELQQQLAEARNAAPLVTDGIGFTESQLDREHSALVDAATADDEE
jgi:flagellar biosynthesis chaperone FliJ